jgi:ABC-type methionine transport system ATPase subunit
MVVERQVRLSYPQRLLRQPLLYGLIHQFDVQTNILEARVEATEGWLLLSVRGEQLRVDQGLEWLRQQGVQVDVLSETKEDR